ncbi:MAG: SDR family oxidoreductase [Kofleriaceae bacterium]|nr:SDR family oxidoreductase [Kofleriaceae bacterium]
MNEENKVLRGKVCIVTGANTGIGRVTAMELARQGAHVFLACRNEAKAQLVVEEIIRETGSLVEFLPLDLGDLQSVRACVKEFESHNLPLHILVNNAGIAGSRGVTTDGFELTFGVNHLGPFLLTNLLLDTLKASAPARIVNVSSRSHYQAKTIDFDAQRQSTASYTGLPEYESSKLANVLFSSELANRLKSTGVTTYAVHPGVVASDIWHRVPWGFRSLVKLFMISVEDGAKTSIDCALSPSRADETGLYYDACKTKRPSKASQDTALAAQLWARSEEWVSVQSSS